MSAVAEPVDIGSQRAALLEMINAHWTTQAIRAACALGLPDRLHAGIADAATLAAGLGCHAPSLQRLLRALVTIGLCSVDADDRYALAPGGEWLREDHPQSLRPWALLAGGPISRRWWELDESVRTGVSHRRRHQGRDSFDELAQDPAAAALFHQAMAALTRAVAGPVSRAVDPLRVRCVADIGGGRGELLAQVLAAHPGLLGVLVDLPHGLDGAPTTLAAAGVASRCTCHAGSFFDPLPAADLYLLKSVLHNWDDARCVQILSRCREAMRAQGSVWLIERPLPERIGTTAADRAVARSDLNMLVALSGRERTAREYAALCAEAGLSMVPEAPAAAGEFRILQAQAA